MSTDLQHATLTLAVVAAMKKRLARVEAEAKAALKDNLKRGTAYVYDGDTEDDDHQLGYAVVPKPPAPKPSVTVDDEARVLPWALDLFGDSAATIRLTEQGTASVREYALAQWEKAGKPDRLEVDGLVVTVAPTRPAAPSFTASKRIEEQVEAMVREGRLSLTDVLALPAPVSEGTAQ